jgi:hypothetical protein
VDRLDHVGGQFHEAVRGRGVGGDVDQNFIFGAANPFGFTAGHYIPTCKRFH